jgi:hypothetical protein
MGSASVEAAAILTLDHRTVSGAASASSHGVSAVDQDSDEPSEPFAPFFGQVSYQAEAGGASSFGSSGQISSLTTSTFFGFGDVLLRASNTGDSPDEESALNGDSIFDVGFTLSEPHVFDFLGFLVTGDIHHGDATAQISLNGPTSFSFVLPPHSVSGSFSKSGTMLAGTYRLFVGVTAEATAKAAQTQFAEGSYQFGLRLTEINGIFEPASLWLLALGAFGTLFRKRQPLR